MATNLVIPSDIESRSAQQKADFYSQQRMAGFADPAIRNAVSGVVGPQSDSDWNYLLQLSGYNNVAPDSQQGSNPFGNSLIAALRNNTPAQPAGSASSYSMLPNRAPAPPAKAPSPAPAPIPNYLNTVRPFGVVPPPASIRTPVTSPDFVGPKQDLRSSLPANWSNLNADQKIAWFNYNNVTPQQLSASGVSAADIDWMTGQGFGTQPQNTQGTRDVISMLPNNWNTFGPTEKINWFNSNSVTPTELQAFGVSQSDIDWMSGKGYGSASTPQPVSQEAQNTFVDTGPPAAPTYSDGQKVDDALPQTTSTRDVANMLPSAWNNFDAQQKINWFNGMSVTPSELATAGVSQGDIDWMRRNGYQVA